MLQLFKKRLSNRKGFTLVELLVVVAIIGVLAAIAIPRFTDATASSNGAKLQADLRTIDSAIMIYYAANNSYLTALSQLSGTYLAITPKEPGSSIKINGTTVPTGSTYGIVSGRAVYGAKKVEELP